jgi:PPE-repeat protein
MDFAALPPEINSGRMYSGPGSGPMLAAAAAWDGLADELYSAAASFEIEIANLTSGSWLGKASTSMSAAAADYIAWLNTTAGQSEQTATQAKAAAGAFEAAFSTTVPPPVIAANRSLLMALIATNLLGQNTPVIATTEAQYAQMWAQDAAAMYEYAAASAAATMLTPFTPPAPAANPAELARQPAQIARVTGTWAATNTQTMLSQLTSTTPAALESVTSPLPSTATSFGSGITGIAQSLGLTNPFNLLGPANTAMSIIGLDNAYAASVSAAQARTAIMNVGYEISGKEDQLLSRFDQLERLPGSAGLGAGLGPVMASAGRGQAGFVGGLSVPQGWAVGAPALRTVAFALPTSSLNAAADGLANGTGSAFSELAVASTAIAGRTAGSTVSQGRGARVVATARASAPFPRTSPGGALTGIADELGKLAELRDSGILTDEEFSRQKRRLLGE